MLLALGRRRVIDEGRRIDGIARCRGLQNLFGAIDLPVAQQRAAEQCERVAADVGTTACALERFDGFVEREAVVARFGVLQPHLAERVINPRVFGRAFERGAERDNGRLRMARPRFGERDHHLALDTVAIESGEHLELIQDVGPACPATVEVRQFLARGDEPGRHRHRLLE